jgi:hypothetical protein
VNYSPPDTSLIKLFSRFFVILKGLYEHIKGFWAFENYYPCEICMLELLPHPKSCPFVSIAKVWFIPQTIFEIGGIPGTNYGYETLFYMNGGEVVLELSRSPHWPNVFYPIVNTCPFLSKATRWSSILKYIYIPKILILYFQEV